MKERNSVPCFCPYCDARISAEDMSTCQMCKVTIFYCPQCKKPMPREKKECPHCGAQVRGK